MTKIIVKGWQKGDLEAEKMIVHFETDGFIWLEFVTTDGQDFRTGLLKEAKV